LQRTIGKQAMRRWLQTDSTLLAHDFSRMPLYARAFAGVQSGLTISAPGDTCEQDADRIADQVMHMPEAQLLGGRSQSEQRGRSAERLQARHLQKNSADLREAPAAVKEVVRSPGQPLDAVTRAFMEPRFGHDFGGVRVHRDASAAQSADAVNARAYALGNDIVFGRGEYDPGTAQGSALIAHELAHVIQQRDSVNSQPVLQRAAKTAKTSAGEFVADPYDATVAQGYGDIVVGYGADITIKFKANQHVDAEKIAFVQTALSVKDDQVHNKYEGDKKKVAESRMIPAGKPGAGVHIDQFPDIRTPLYGMTGSTGDDLASSEPAKKLTAFGWHYIDANKKLQNSDAMMHDEPDLTSGDMYTEAADVMNREWHQHFETTALAIAGNQKGTFYGSVEWGWTKKASDLRPSLLEFKTRSKDVASPIFLEAAKLWNVSVTTGKKDSIDLPVDVHITSQSAQLWDSPDQRKLIATLTKDTPLGRTARVDPKGRTWWASVIVTGGPKVGKAGWVKEVDLYIRS
jgi:hypothetical protein